MNLGARSRAILVASCLPALLALAQQTRESRTAPVGSAQLTGLVVSGDDAHTPIRRAIVTLSGPGLGIDRSVIADDAGRFGFDRLPAGSFTVTASKAAYLPAAFGAKRPGHGGTPIVVAAGQQVTDLVLRLFRAGVIAGTVHEADGTPIPGLQVMALLNGTPPARIGGQPLTAPDSTFTNDRGDYRIYGLTPGSYAVVAIMTATELNELHRRTTAELDAEFREAQQRGLAPTSPPLPPPVYAVAPIYFPGTPVAADAVRVDVTVGSIRDDVSFTAEPVPSAAIEGVVDRPPGATGRLTLLISGPGGAMPLSIRMGPRLITPPGADGKFRYVNVSPGQYTLAALITDNAPAGTAPPAGSGGRGGAPVTFSPPIWWASQTVAVNGDDITGLALDMQPGMSVSGRIRLDLTSTPVPTDLTILRVALQPTGSTATAMINGTSFGSAQRTAFARVEADGTFAITGVAPGPYRISVTEPGTSTLSSLWIRSAMIGGTDALDSVLTIAPGQVLDHLVITLTDRHTELGGALQTPEGRPATEYFVVAVPADRTVWRPESRRIRSTRPATDGHYAFTDLPPGSYLVAAIDDLEPTDLADPTFLETIATAGVPVTLAEGELKRQDLRLR